MKLFRVDQNLKCFECGKTHPVRLCQRWMNFTSGEIVFYCRNCHAKLGHSTFARWNEIHRDYYEKPKVSPSLPSPVVQRSRDRHRRRENRSGRERR